MGTVFYDLENVHLSTTIPLLFKTKKANKTRAYLLIKRDRKKIKIENQDIPLKSSFGKRRKRIKCLLDKEK